MKTILLSASLFAAVVLAGSALPAEAADAVTTAANFTTVALAVGKAIAMGIVMVGAILWGLSFLLTNPKLGASGKGAAVVGIILLLIDKVVAVATGTASQLLG